ncbi:DUF6048 family protein [Lutibacter sp.]|uniref:DUF6048 family protein n=1 Tax=Lutibacter sp. TaxID=1925666 RepID=UPI0035648BC1
MRISIFIISLFVSIVGFAQQKTDTLKLKQTYGLRVGADISKPITSFIDSDKKGFEITGDLRFSKNHYAAAELGYEDVITTEDFITFTTSGSYIKLGVNYNAYRNWAGMNNEIFFGGRYAFSFFSQTLNNYTPNSYGTYFEADLIEPNTEYKDLSAHWLEFVAGMKVETFKNIYFGAQINIKKLITTKEPDNFENLYIPGFNKVFSNDLGIGFNYSISYLIPIIKKTK